MRTMDMVVRHDIQLLNKLLSNPELEHWAVLKVEGELAGLKAEAHGFDADTDTFHIYREAVESKLDVEPIQNTVWIDPEIILF